LSKTGRPDRRAGGTPTFCQPNEESDMRFMILVKADRNSEAGVMPSEQLLTEMGASTRNW
jgi:hypothetical protein